MNKILQVGVKIFLKNTEGNFLFLKRSKEKYPEVEGDQWDIAGGRIEPGTELLENLRREIFEETRLKLKNEPKLIAAQDILKNTDKHVVRLTYFGEIEGTPILNDDHTTFRWLTPFEMTTFQGIDRYASEIIEKKLLEK